MARRSPRSLLLGSLLASIPLVGVAFAVGVDDFEDEPILYRQTAARDPIAGLASRVERGEVRLVRDRTRSYLPAILSALKIPTSSQMLVFSKTSFQRDFISPQTPRAIYFNEHTYVGWVQHSDIVEIATTDPNLGAVFYVVRPDEQGKPRFSRQIDECLQCHSSSLTAGVPGHLIRSVFPDANGQPYFAAGTFLSTDESPWRERWGGWYVTGRHGKQPHMGNVTYRTEAAALRGVRQGGPEVTDLKRLVNTRPYLSDHSDIVALLVAEHQSRLHNLITRANYQTRMALHYERMLNRELGRPAGYRSESTVSRIRSVCEPLVRALVFSRETPLQEPVSGTSTFVRDFSAAGVRDAQGRTLREFDLKRRLFRYPISYMVQTEAFDALPIEARDVVFDGINSALTGASGKAEFARVPQPEGREALQILAETSPAFAGRMRQLPR